MKNHLRSEKIEFDEKAIKGCKYDIIALCEDVSYLENLACGGLVITENPDIIVPKRRKKIKSLRILNIRQLP